MGYVIRREVRSVQAPRFIVMISKTREQRWELEFISASESRHPQPLPLFLTRGE
jgi:hypothetical protein